MVVGVPQAFEEFSVVGGAIFPLEEGGTGASWPLVRATVNDEGVRVEGRVGRKLFSMSCTFTWGSCVRSRFAERGSSFTGLTTVT
jgi:hypothetical protein